MFFLHLLMNGSFYLGCGIQLTFNHGGICMYIHDSIRYDVSDIMDEKFEVFWILLTPVNDRSC